MLRKHGSGRGRNQRWGEVNQGRTRISCVQRGVKKGLAMDDLSLLEKPVYSTFWFVPFFPNDEARTEQYMEQAGVVGIATWLSFIFGRG